MNMTLATRRLVAWIATFAVLMLTLAPAISNAMADSASPGWMDVCSSVGIAVTKISNQDQPGKPSLHFEHCPYCFTHAGTFAMPATPVFSLPVVKANFPFPQLYYQSSQPLFAWSSAQPRAPPLFV
jgi:hypothetical protein